MRCFSSCQPYQSFTNHQNSSLLMPSLWPHTHTYVTNSSYTSHVEIMPTFIPNPSFVIQESYYVYLILHYIHIAHHTFIPNQNKPFRNKQTSNHSIVSPSTSLRLRGLAQARRARSGEPPSPRRGLERASRN